MGGESYGIEIEEEKKVFNDSLFISGGGSVLIFMMFNLGNESGHFHVPDGSKLKERINEFSSPSLITDLSEEIKKKA